MQYSTLTMNSFLSAVGIRRSRETSSALARGKLRRDIRPLYNSYLTIAVHPITGSGLRLSSDMVRRYSFMALGERLSRISGRSLDTENMVWGAVYDAYANSSVMYVRDSASRYLEMALWIDLECFIDRLTLRFELRYDKSSKIDAKWQEKMCQMGTLLDVFISKSATGGTLFWGYKWC